jgi:hypothetical protein
MAGITLPLDGILSPFARATACHFLAWWNMEKCIFPSLVKLPAIIGRQSPNTPQHAWNWTHS